MTKHIVEVAPFAHLDAPINCCIFADRLTLDEVLGESERGESKSIADSYDDLAQRFAHEA